jgi:serine protease SohB
MEYGLFLAKAVTIVVSVFLILGAIMSMGMKHKTPEKGVIEVSKLNEKYDFQKELLSDAIETPEVRKQQLKEEKKQDKQKKKDLKNKDTADEVTKKRSFVLHFHGDIKASAVESLREEINCILALAKPCDEVIILLESGGGMVHSYGLASSQLDRIKKKDIPLTVCIDKVAASGGYMMACVADKIIAAPFAVIGSIGVVAQIPNFNKLLKKNDIDFEMLTAGDHKRTLTMFGENTDKGREKFVEDLEDTHLLFKEFVSQRRPKLNITEVANGDVWFGQRALEKDLIDDIATSDEYLLDAANSTDVFEVRYVHKKSIPEKLGIAAQLSIDNFLLTWVERLQGFRFFS